MSKGNSFKAEPWTALYKGTWSIFDDDFISDKLTFKFNKKSATSGIQYKENFALKDAKVDKFSDQVKIWFPFNTNTLYLRLKGNTWKAHVDHGVQEKNGYLFNLYGSVQGGRQLGAESFKVGLETAKDNWTWDTRVAVKPSTQDMVVYSKKSFKHDKWRWWSVNAVNPLRKEWIHSSFQVARSEECCSFWLRATAGNKWNKVNPSNLLTNVTADYIYNYNPNNKLGVEVNANLLSQKVLNAAVVWDHSCADRKNTSFKIKSDISRNIAVAIKNNIEGYGNYLVGINVADFGVGNKFSYGVQLELNL